MTSLKSDQVQLMQKVVSFVNETCKGQGTFVCLGVRLKDQSRVSAVAATTWFL